VRKRKRRGSDEKSLLEKDHWIGDRGAMPLNIGMEGTDWERSEKPLKEKWGHFESSMQGVAVRPRTVGEAVRDTEE